MFRFFRLLLLILLLAGCTPVASTPGPGKSGSNDQAAPVRLVQSQKGRSAPAAPGGEDEKKVVQGQTRFALDLYRVIRSSPGKENLFASPYSISLALAMTYAGARGTTAAEMASALHFDLPQEQLHPAYNALDADIASRGKPQNKDEKGFQLSIANSLWGQDEFPFQQAFLDLLAQNYSAGLRLVDFKKAPEPARQAINQWVSDETQKRIQDLIPQGAVDNNTRLVLANAIYFKAAWLSPFRVEDTQNKPFHLDSSQTVSVPIMQQSSSKYTYASGEGWQAVEIPYEGSKLAMLVLLPDQGTLPAFEDSLNAEKLDTILSSLHYSTVNLSLPRFKFETSLALVDAMKNLGMKAAFDPDQADFSGMDGARDLFVGNILHKAFVAVDEAGTEATASTAVIMELAAAPAEPVSVMVDHPFLFHSRDRETGSILFIGRVANPQ